MVSFANHIYWWKKCGDIFSWFADTRRSEWLAGKKFPFLCMEEPKNPGCDLNFCLSWQTSSKKVGSLFFEGAWSHFFLHQMADAWQKIFFQGKLLKKKILHFFLEDIRVVSHWRGSNFLSFRVSFLLFGLHLFTFSRTFVETQQSHFRRQG